ncbi:MAG: transcriptional regulator with GAF, ATPase, and Fis domain [Pseudohongiellaceae bacterium]|jgi:transcriptional regulator with GAF, ATPase, and Fis domain
MNPALLQRVSLQVAASRRVDDVLQGLVRGIAEESGIALSRIWLRLPGGPCETCNQISSCVDQSECLHLVASAGSSRLDPEQRWDTCVDSRYGRFPLSVRKVGRIGATGQGELLCLERDGQDWLANPGWAEAEGIRVFAGQPLCFSGKVLGVLAVFSRDEIDDEGFAWLRTFADQAAVALANARAFEEVELLQQQLERERDYLREEFVDVHSRGGIIGSSQSITQVLRQIELVAPSDAPVLVLGESGTGKELIATAIHDMSERSDGPMVRVNCASIPSELFESEFFGHVRGSFTGATGDRSGRFLVADGGTLLLDEIGEIPLALQGKLLRALQDGEFSPVGSDRVLTGDVRIVASTNRDLAVEASEGRFRQDLYYRLAVFPLQVPALRERKEDIPALAAHFLKRIASRRSAASPILRQRDVDALMAYNWPGNVRELQNAIERAVILGTAGRLHIDLQPNLSASTASTSAAAQSPSMSLTAGDDQSIVTEADRLLDLAQNIRRALQAAGGKVSGPKGAADLLGIKPTTLTSRMKTLGIPRR